MKDGFVLLRRLAEAELVDELRGDRVLAAPVAEDVPGDLWRTPDEEVEAPDVLAVVARRGREDGAPPKREAPTSCCRRATRAEIKPAMRHRLDATQVFNGADSIFRGILVPIFGLKAQLLRRDARVLAEETTKGLTAEQKAAVVASFNEGVSKKTN